MPTRVEQQRVVSLPETTITATPPTAAPSNAAPPPPNHADTWGAEDAPPPDLSRWLLHQDTCAQPRPTSSIELPDTVIRAGVAAAGRPPSSSSTPSQIVRQHALADDIARILQDESLEPGELVGDDDSWFASSGALETRLTASLSYSQKAQLATLCAHPDTLASFLEDTLAARSDLSAGSSEVKRIAQSVREELQQEVSWLVESDITSRVHSATSQAGQLLDRFTLPGTPETIATMVSEAQGSRALVEANLSQNLGLSREAAEDLLDGMWRRPPAQGAQHFRAWVDDQRDGLEQLRERSSTHGMTAELLTDDLFADVRREAVASLSARYGPGVELAFEARRAHAVSEARTQTWVSGALQVATGVAMSVATGGSGPMIAAAVAAGTSAAGSLPGIIDAHANVAVGHAADLATISNGRAGREAEIDRNIAVGKALADTFFGVAPSGTSGALNQTVEALIQSASTEGAATFADWITH